MIKINVNSFEDLQKTGVYKIQNLINNKCYIGSTQVSFMKRLQHHVGRLMNQKHKNTYLQNSWNKYGEENFEFSILEVTEKENTLNREQYYLDNTEYLYNINPLATGTPSLDKDTIKKRRNTMLKKYTSGEFDYIKEILRNKIPWNKGLTKEDMDYSFLKGIEKTVTDKLIRKRILHKEMIREKSPDIYVYDINRNFLGHWRSSKDLEDWSKTSQNNLPIKSRFKGTSRMGIPVKQLQSVNINKSCKTGKSYKNLYFSNKPLHQVIDDRK